MNATYGQPRPLRRWSAICIELLPLLALPLWYFVPPQGGRLAGFNFLIFTTGIGWLIAGRLRAAAAASLGRLAVMAVPISIWAIVFYSSQDCPPCPPRTILRAAATLGVASFVLTTLASAGWLAWSTRPNRPTARTGDDKRVLAISLELLPLVVTGVWPDLYNGVGAASFVVALAFTSGLGWLVLGRRRIGLFIVLGRGLIIAYLWSTYPFGVGYPHPATVSMLVLSFIVYALPTMASAAALAWMSQKSRPPTAVG